MFLRATIIVAVAGVTLAVAHVMAQVPPLTRVMNEKADNAQRMLRPLVIADFAAADRYAERLGRLTYTEVASWQGSADTDYLAQATAFVRAVQDLRTAFRQQDVSEASLAYAALIDSCVRCHQHLRGRRAVSLTAPPATLDSPR